MAEGNVVGSAEFELRATRSKIQGDMEAARREVAEAAKRTEAELEGIVGTGTSTGRTPELRPICPRLTDGR